MTRTQARIGIIGLGKWGSKLLRVFASQANVAWCAARSQDLSWVSSQVPGVKTTHDLDEMLSAQLDAIVIATPIKQHYALASKALKAQRHVFVEKPLSQTIHQAQGLWESAQKRNRILFTGHTFTFHPAFEKLESLLAHDPVECIRSEWDKLGSFEEPIFENLIPHELSVAIRLFGKKPVRAFHFAQKKMFLSKDQLEISYAYSNHRYHFIRLNRMSPTPRRRMEIRTRSGAYYVWENDNLFLASSEQKKFESIPLKKTEPLQRECAFFLDLLKSNDYKNPALLLGVQVVEAMSL